MTTIQELADKIRDRVDLNFSQKVHPDRRHLHATAIAVAGVLGMAPDALNIGHLMGLLATQTGRPSYPKMKYHHGKRASHTVANAQEEAALGEEWVDHHWGGAR